GNRGRSFRLLPGGATFHRLKPLGRSLDPVAFGAVLTIARQGPHRVRGKRRDGRAKGWIVTVPNVHTTLPWATGVAGTCGDRIPEADASGFPLAPALPAQEKGIFLDPYPDAPAALPALEPRSSGGMDRRALRPQSPMRSRSFCAGAGGIPEERSRSA